jgi:hypothetical protein
MLLSPATARPCWQCHWAARQRFPKPTMVLRKLRLEKWLENTARQRTEAQRQKTHKYSKKVQLDNYFFFWQLNWREMKANKWGGGESKNCLVYHLVHQRELLRLELSVWGWQPWRRLQMMQKYTRAVFQSVTYTQVNITHKSYHFQNAVVLQSRD